MVDLTYMEGTLLEKIDPIVNVCAENVEAAKKYLK